MTRIAITGGPRTGKTTLSVTLSVDLMRQHPGLGSVSIHTDDFIGKLDWSETSAEVARRMDRDGPWIIEGVVVSRALRKWRERHPGEAPPVDKIIYLVEPHDELTKGQAAMAKGVRKVHDEIEGWLNQHGVRTEYR